MRSKGKRITSKNKNKIFKNFSFTKKIANANAKLKTKIKQHDYRSLAKVVAVLCLVSVVLFEITLIRLNILPAKYMLTALLVFTPFGVLVFLGLFFNRVKKRPRIIAAVLSVILIFISVTGTSYVTGTMDFLDKISSIGETFSYEKYNVIVKVDSEVEEIEELSKTEVGIYSTSNESYSKARNELKELIECEYKNVEGLDTLGNELLDGEKKSIFISETNYSVLDESIQGYKEKTKVIYTIEIKTLQKDSARRIDVTEESFNIYVSGIDTYGEIGNVARSDVNMIITVNPKTNKILLTSIPRDCVVMLPTYEERDKLTHSGLYGVNESIGAIENLMGIKINYYMKINFSAFEDLVDAINGIDVDSDFKFRGEVYGYNFVKGINHMNGRQAISFARERHSFPSGDFQRVKNQQKVIEAILTKVSSSSTLLMNYNGILNAVEGSMDTNFAPKEIKSLVKMQLGDMPKWVFEKSSVDQGSDALLTGHSYQYQELYMFVPDEDAIMEAEDKINAVMSEE